MTGTYRTYVPRSFRAAKLATIGRAAEILDAAEVAGEVYSVRQVYYQFVQRGWLPNVEESYAHLQSAISDGRLAGMLSWTSVEDRGRALRGLGTWSSPAAALEQAVLSYRRDLWAEQEWRPEVWVEKAALEAVVGTICDQLRVDYYACRGYNSQSEQWAAGQRLASYVRAGQRPIVLHLGDHDPSGLDMTRDNRDRLSLFAGVPVQVVRLALNRDQVDALSLPPNPAKFTDSRAGDYVRQHGPASWELDALPSEHIRGLIRDAVDRLRDPTTWDASLAREVAERRELEDFARGDREDLV